MPPRSELECQIDLALGTDRHRLRRLLRSVREAERSGRPFDRNLERLTRELEQSVARREARRAGVPTIKYDSELPVVARRDEIAEAIREHQVVIVSGETGSGKSTQLPKICLELGRGIDGLIGHTQPRRIATRSVAARVAEELGTPLGQQVGFKIRFADSTGPNTYIKLMTDGILLAETQHDRFLDRYDTLIIDEAHERSLNIDFLLGYLKRLLPKRPDLKLIITSATIDAERYAEHFGGVERQASRVESPKGSSSLDSTGGLTPPARLEGGTRAAPVIQVSGRAYPVEVRWRPPELDEDGNEPDLWRGLLDAVDEAARVDYGDMLIFMPTERAIHEAAKQLRSHTLPGDGGRGTEILPLYARLSTKEQQRIFQPHPHRRIVIATNVAESSLTVPGIRFVIDPGTARISRYSPRSKVQRLPIEAVSQASADQRKGRCGRVGPGVCIRLYSEEDYNGRERFTPPEIQRTNLASVILQTKALKLGAIEEFPFLDPPKPEAIRDGYKTLFELGAIDERNELTALGRQMSRLPADPRIARIILAGHEEQCLHEILIIAAALEIQDPRERPLEQQQAADEAHAKFADESSDFLSYLKLWEFYHQLRDSLSRNQLRKACRQNFLSYNRLLEWVDVHRQLLQLVEAAGMKVGRRAVAPPAAAVKGRGSRVEGKRRGEESPSLNLQFATLDLSSVHRALLTGFLSSIAFRGGESPEYTVAGGTKAFVWPGSGVFAKKPKWIVASEVVETSRRYLRTAARIDPGWIERLAGHLVNRSYSEPHWDEKGASAVAFERVSLFGLIIVPRRRVRYGAIDPVKSRELFLQHGLVEGQYVSRGEFQAHNRQLLDEVEALVTKTRQPHLLKPEEARYEFYDARVPADVYDGPRFEKWRRAAERETPRLLYLSRSDVMESAEEEATSADFPDAIAVGKIRLPLEYHFEPGTEQDGVTLTVPVEGLNQIDPHRMGWLVPGLLEEKVVALIKSLPKPLRRNLVPAPDTAKRTLRELRFGEGAFLEAVAAVLSRLSGEPIRPENFEEAKLPPNLRMNVRVVDAAGAPLASGRDLGEIRRELGSEASASLTALDEGEWTRDGITTWDFGELPKSIDLSRGGVALTGYPALLDRGESVSLRLLDTPVQAALESRRGVRRLFILSMRRGLKSQVAWLPKIDQLRLLAATLPESSKLDQHLAELIANRALFREPSLPRTAAEFEQKRDTARGSIGTAVQEVTALIGPLVEAYHQAKVALERATAPAWQPAAADMQHQLALLTTAGFLTSTQWEWLLQYPRYFRAMVFRLQKLAGGGLAQDQRAMQQLLPRWRAYLERARRNQEQGIFDAELAHYRWMLEEYRVSLFAQKLGTAISVSEQRLEKQWAKVRA